MDIEVDARIRSQRLSNGRCPNHGSIMVNKEPLIENEMTVGVIYRCPTEGCTVEFAARTGSRLHKLLR